VLEGLPTLVVDYDDMMADPARSTEEIVRFLEQVDVDVAPGLDAAAASHLDSGLHHQKAEEDQYYDFAHVQRQIFDVLQDRRGFHGSWKPPRTFPPPPLWVEDALRMGRDLQMKARQLRKLKSTLPMRIEAKFARLTGRSDRFSSSP
jgi:hypothetical protein